MALKPIAQIRQPSAEKALPVRLDLPASLRPIDDRELAVRLDRALCIWPLPANWGERAAVYLSALRDVPVDLIERALDHATKTCKWLPQPSEIREPIEAELERRRRHHREMAALAAREAENARQIEDRERWQRTGYDPDDEMRKRALAEIAEAVAAANPRGKPEDALRIDSPGANARRNALREAFDRHLADTLQPPESAPA